MGFSLVLYKLGVVAHPCNPALKKVEARESGVPVYPLLYSKFEASLSYTDPDSKQTTTIKNSLDQDPEILPVDKNQHRPGTSTICFTGCQHTN